jgi:hypothetical protein
VGGVLSRALGSQSGKKHYIPGNQIMMTFFYYRFVVLVFFGDEMLMLLVLKALLWNQLKRIFLFHNYKCSVFGTLMMGNNVIRAEGKPKLRWSP